MRNIGTVALVVVTAIFVWWLRGCFVPTPDPADPEIVYRDREIIKRDTVTIDRPVTRILYRTTTDTVYHRVPVPVGFSDYRLVSPTPIRIDGQDVTLSFWSPDSLRWEQSVYRIRQRRWALWLDGGAGYDLDGFYVSPRVNLRITRLTAFVGYQWRDEQRGLEFGLRYRILGIGY